MEKRTYAARRYRPSIFYRLPEELLVLILDNLLADDEAGNGQRPVGHNNRRLNSNLKNLRLASREYTHLSHLHSALFRSVRFTASLYHLRLLRTQGVSTLKPYAQYVQRVVFLPGEDARSTELDLRNGKLQCTWANLLEELPNVHSIHVGTVSDPLFTVILSSLSDGSMGARIRDLSIGHHDDGAFSWVTDGRLEGLDLSNLRSLNWCPRFAHWVDGNPASRSGHGLTRFLKQHAKIENIAIGNTPIEWLTCDDNGLVLPGMPDLPDLPDLQHLSIGPKAFVHPIGLGTLLRTAAPSLTKLTFTSLNSDIEWPNWRELRDAIRDHSRLMMLESDRTRTVPRGDISIELMWMEWLIENLVPDEHESSTESDEDHTVDGA